MKKKLVLICLGFIIGVFVLETTLQIGALITRRTYRVDHIFKNKNALRVLCLGDSFTFGIGAGKGKSYPVQLQLLLNKKLAEQPVQVINMGCPGINTAMIANKIGYILDIYSPHIVLIMSGANDLWNLQGIFPENRSFVNRIYFYLSKTRTYRLLKIISFNFDKFVRGKHNYDIFSSTILSQKKIKEHLGQRMFGDLIRYEMHLKTARHYKLKKMYYEALECLFFARCMNFLKNLVYIEMDDLFICWDDHLQTVSFYRYLKKIFPNDLEIDLRLARQYKALQDYNNSRKYFCNILLTDPHCEIAQEGVLGADFFLAHSITHGFSQNSLQGAEFYENLFSDNTEGDFGQGSERFVHERPQHKVILEDSDYELLVDLCNLDQNNWDSLDKYDQKDFLYSLYYDKLKVICAEAKARKIDLFFVSYPSFTRDYILITAKEQGIHYVDLRYEVLRQVDNNNYDTYFTSDGHCTAEGYKLVAKVIGKNIISCLNSCQRKAEKNR